MANLATAYVQILPSTAGLGGALASDLESAGAEAGKKGGDEAGSKFGDAFKGTMKALGGALAGAGAAVGAMIKGSVDQFSDFEQLSGGIAKLFGEDADLVAIYAQEAWKSAGLSANEYLETVTGFSASLISGLEGDTYYAAELADTAISDMADNANTFGTSIDSIQAAYSGFAKGNYTMLDNLKLGYGGTASEMVRLINNSGILEEEIENLDGISFDQIINAIHRTQVEMGIFGTTSKEAASTIQGSSAAMGAAWQNTLLAMGDDNADFGAAIDTLVGSVSDFAGNIIPRIQIAINGVGQLITALAPVIASEIPGLVTSLLPGFVEAALSIVAGLLEALPQILEALLTVLGSAAEMLVGVLPELIPTLVAGLVSMLMTTTSALIGALPEMITTIVTSALAMLPQIVQLGLDLFLGLVSGLVAAIPQIIAQLPTLVNSIISTLVTLIPMLTQAGLQLFEALLSPDNLSDILEAITAVLPDLIVGVIDGLIVLLPEIISAGVTLFTALITNLPEIIKTLVLAMPGIIAAIVSALLEGLSDLASAGADLIKSLFSGMDGFDIRAWISEKWENAKAWFSEFGSSFVSTITDDFWPTVSGAFNTLVENLKSIFDFDWHLPSIVLPHFKFTGKFSLTPLSVPTLSIDWYAKAMENGMILDSPTIFGAKDGEFLGAGEAGAEAVVGVHSLLDMITNAVDNATDDSNEYERLLAVNTAILSKLDKMGVYLDGKTLVGELSADIDEALGRRSMAVSRGYA